MTAVQEAPAAAGPVDEGLNRQVGLLGLMWASEGSIIGSGWLFASLVALTIAGPSALIGWVIASGIVILLALVHAELGGARRALFRMSGLLGAALYNPVWTSAVKTPGDFALALVGFVLLTVWQAPPLVVVALSALGGIGLALIASP